MHGYAGDHGGRRTAASGGAVVTRVSFAAPSPNPTAGPQVIGWNGRDDAGRGVASGTYFARLRVRGPGVSQELSRKINVIR